MSVTTILTIWVALMEAWVWTVLPLRRLCCHQWFPPHEQWCEQRRHLAMDPWPPPFLPFPPAPTPTSSSSESCFCPPPWPLRLPTSTNTTIIWIMVLLALHIFISSNRHCLMLCLIPPALTNPAIDHILSDKDVIWRCQGWITLPIHSWKLSLWRMPKNALIYVCPIAFAQHLEGLPSLWPSSDHAIRC